MTIVNKTKIESEMIKGVRRASNFDNNRYKIFKLIYNFFGLLFGMMMVRYLVLEMIGSQRADKVMLWFYVFATTILLYLGMIGMDKSSKKKFQLIYKNMVGITFTYHINSDEIVMTDPDNDSETFTWDRVVKWNQDIDNFYLFVSSEECLILSKNGFTEGTSKDFKDLATAVMEMRQIGSEEDGTQCSEISENTNGINKLNDIEIVENSVDSTSKEIKNETDTK